MSQKRVDREWAAKQAREAKEMAEKVYSACPELAGMGTDPRNVLDQVFVTAGAMQTSLEQLIGAGSKADFSAEAAVAFMAHGAYAFMLENGFPDGDLRTKLYRAGRHVGKYMAARYAESVDAALLAKSGGKTS